MKKISKMNLFLICYDTLIFILFYILVFIISNTYNLSKLNWSCAVIGALSGALIKVIIYYFMKTYNTLLKYVSVVEVTKLCFVFFIIENLIGVVLLSFPIFQIELIPFYLGMCSQILFLILGRIA